MQESVAYSKIAAQVKKTTPTDDGDGAGGSEGKGGGKGKGKRPKAKGKAKAKARAKPPASAMGVPLNSNLEPENLMWIEDVASLLDAAYTQLPHEIDDKERKLIKGVLISVAVEFCWRKALCVNGEVFKVYSQLRSVLFDRIAQSHREVGFHGITSA